MAELASNAREYDKAINFYKEGLAYDETYLPVWVTELSLMTFIKPRFVNSNKCENILQLY